ncbi:MAG: acetylxylan esterase [Clostridiales bacterium]|jgi:cephalosporin-C deacetylase|nr:acetylxylan esterase [Clostridiales bacterium]
MPILDMPLEQLYLYGGRNPRPDDFDAYWEAGLAEAANTPLGLTAEKVPGLVARNAECYDLYFDSVKNSRVYCRYARPANVKPDEKLPVLLQFHGYGGDGGPFVDKIAWAGQGYIVLAMDCRGQGGRSEDCNPVKGRTQGGLIMRGFDDPDPTNLYFRNVFLDTVQIVKAAKSLPNADPDRIYATGGSQGGALTVACAALNGKDIKKAAPVHPFLCDYKRVWEMDLARNAYHDIYEHLRFYYPTYEKQAGFWERLGHIDLQFLAPRITADVLWATGLMDNICPPSSQFAAYNKIKSKKQIRIYPDFAHEGMPGLADEIMTFLNT